MGLLLRNSTPTWFCFKISKTFWSESECKMTLFFYPTFLYVFILPSSTKSLSWSQSWPKYARLPLEMKFKTRRGMMLHHFSQREKEMTEHVTRNKDRNLTGVDPQKQFHNNWFCTCSRQKRGSHKMSFPQKLLALNSIYNNQNTSQSNNYHHLCHGDSHLITF